MKLRNGEILQLKYSGICRLTDNMVLYDVLYVPEFTVNLISVSKLVSDNGVSLLFNKSGSIVQDQLSRILVKTGEAVGGLFHTRRVASVFSSSVNVQNNMKLWHFRLVHASYDIVNKLLKHKIISIRSTDVKTGCMICPLAKHHKLPFSLSSYSVHDIF